MTLSLWGHLSLCAAHVITLGTLRVHVSLLNNKTHRLPGGGGPSSAGHKVAQPGVRGSSACVTTVSALHLSQPALWTFHAADPPGLWPTSTSGWAQWPRICSPPKPSTIEKMKNNLLLVSLWESWFYLAQNYIFFSFEHTWYHLNILHLKVSMNNREMKWNLRWDMRESNGKIQNAYKREKKTGLFKTNIQLKLDKCVVAARYLRGQAWPWHSSTASLLLILSLQIRPFSIPLLWAQFLPSENITNKMYLCGFRYWKKSVIMSVKMLIKVSTCLRVTNPQLNNIC